MCTPTYSADNQFKDPVTEMMMTMMAIHGHGNVLRNRITTAPIKCLATTGIEMFNSEPKAVKITSSTSSEASWQGTLHRQENSFNHKISPGPW